MKNKIILSSFLFVFTVTFVSMFYSTQILVLISKLLYREINYAKWHKNIIAFQAILCFFSFIGIFLVIFYSKVIDYYNKNKYQCYIIFFTILALMCRVVFFPFESGDYTGFLKPWYDQFYAGRLTGFRSEIGNYTVPYQYIIAIITFLHVPPLYSYKIVSIVFDILLALFGSLIIFELTKSDLKKMVCYIILLFLPNIILNSACWGQCDSIYSFFIILCTYYLLINKEKKALISYTIAFAFKVQAIFYLPVLVVLLFKNKFSLKSLWVMPITYSIVVLPAIILGMSPVYALFGAYIKQTMGCNSINMNACNLYFLLPENFCDSSFSHYCILITFTLCFVYFLLFTNNEYTNEKLIIYIYVYSLIIPFFLPHMHERYFYLSEVIGIIFSLVFVKSFYIPAMTVPASLPFLCSYLYGIKSINTLIFSVLLMFAGIICLHIFLFHNFNFYKKTKEIYEV